jgi:hypothetical protein
MRWVREHYLRRVLVHTTDGATFDGLLQSSERAAVVLVQATYTSSATEQSVPLAGETYVPRERIAFMQRPGGEGK